METTDLLYWIIAAVIGAALFWLIGEKMMVNLIMVNVGFVP